jgi:2-polyprenyl-3-methyl-5-hydroxy-6-metoxy-1,4-benzoquinol methylase
MIEGTEGLESIEKDTVAAKPRLARYGVKDWAEEQRLRASLRAFYERTLKAGQGAYFNVVENTLVPTQMGRFWLTEHIVIFTRLLNLSRTDSFLDVGCGEGFYTMVLAQQAGYGIGVDMSQSVLKVLQGLKNFPKHKLRLVNSDVERLPFADASFDKILCSHVLEHVLDDRAVLHEIQRVLKPEGRAVLAIPLKYTPQHKALQLATDLGRTILKPGKQKSPTLPPGTLNLGLVGRQAHIRHHSLQSFQKLVESEGFVVEKVSGVWFHDPRNWFVRKTQRWALTYRFGTRLSKIWPQTGAGLVLLVRKA